MFPLVPYHNLPELARTGEGRHARRPIRDPFEAWREILPTVLRQVKDPAYHVKRKLPDSDRPRRRRRPPRHIVTPRASRCRWLDRGLRRRRSRQPKTSSASITTGRPTPSIRDCRRARFTPPTASAPTATPTSPTASSRASSSSARNTTGASTSPTDRPHAPGLRGAQDLQGPRARRQDLPRPHIPPVAAARAQLQTTYNFRVVSNENVATFIKELVLEPEPGSELPPYQPGDYLQLDIPAYGEIALPMKSPSVQPFAEVWKNPARLRLPLGERHARPPQLLARLQSGHRQTASLQRPHRHPAARAGLPGGRRLRLCPPAQTRRRGHGHRSVRRLPHQARRRGKWSMSAAARAWPRCARTCRTSSKPCKTARRVSFWYGARSRQEIFYQEYFEDLARQHPNFTFHLALSEPLPEDNWTGPTGFIHEVLREAIPERATPTPPESNTTCAVRP